MNKKWTFRDGLVAGTLMAVGALGWGCDGRSPEAGKGEEGAVTVHATRGVVRDMAEDRRTAVIRHEEIPGYMPRMTMSLNVRDTNELVGIQVGDEVTFRLLADDDTHWIDTVRRVGKVELEPELTREDLRGGIEPLEPGEPMPDHSLVDEDGGVLRFSEFRGRAVVFTMVFTRCPLPDYCPRMSRRFAEARDWLRNSASGTTNWQFVSISFDPENDTPEILRGYGNVVRGGDGDRWRFAVASAETLAVLAPQIDLHYSRSGGSISHNLRTVVLDTEGRVHRQFDGNLWTGQQLGEAVAEAAGRSAGE